MRKIIVPGTKDASGAYVKEAPVEPFRLDKFLFDKQLKFVEDPRPFKVAVCSRRAGKTIACAADLIDTALKHEGITCLYITLARTNAQRILWPELIKINSKYKLGGVPDLIQLTITFPNGSIVWCSGAKDASEIEKFRGHALKKVYIDECQAFRAHLKDLIDDVLIPALMDYDGSLCLIGTPGAVPAGYFAEISGAVIRTETEEDDEDQEFNWVRYHWTFFDNPYIAKKSKKTHEQVLRRVLKMRGVTIDDPSIQREFFGKWVMDQDSLWVKYSPKLNHFIEMPDISPLKWNYIMGIDLGFEDADAIAVIAWSEKTPATYLVEERTVNKQGLTELVEQIQELQQKYNCGKMVIDEGGLGKKLAEEMRRRHHIPVQPADKTRKQENVEFLNDALRTSRFKAKSASRFAQDTYLVEIDWDKSRPDKVKVSDKYHSDIIDAVLYAFKESPAFTFQATVKEPVYGTKEWAEKQNSSMFEAELEGLQREADMAKYMSGLPED